VILVTSLDATKFSTQEIADLYRMRWRIETAFNLNPAVDWANFA
jgi:IS4 transposase